MAVAKADPAEPALQEQLTPISALHAEGDEAGALGVLEAVAEVASDVGAPASVKIFVYLAAAAAMPPAAAIKAREVEFAGGLRSAVNSGTSLS